MMDLMWGLLALGLTSNDVEILEKEEENDRKLRKIQEQLDRVESKINVLGYCEFKRLKRRVDNYES